MTILGQYDFRNTFFLNPGIEPSELYSTVVHEHAHMLLSKTTVWGMTLICLRKLEQLSQLNLISRKTYCSLNEFFSSRIKTIQEAIAVYVEIVFCIKCSGWEEAVDFLVKLRTENTEYYHYVERLKVIIDIMRKERINGKQLDQITNLVFEVGKMALDSPIFEIDPKIFRSAKAIQRFVSTKEFSRYNPNTIFKKLIHCIQNSHPATGKEMIGLLRGLLQDRENIGIEDFKQRLISVQKFLINIFSNERNKDWVEAQLNKISVREIDIEKLVLQQEPIPLDTEIVLENIFQFSQKEIDEKVGFWGNVVLVFGSMQLAGEIFFGRMGMKASQIQDNISQGILNQYACILYDFPTGKMGPFICESAFFQQLVGRCEEGATVVLNYKCYDYQKNLMISFGDLPTHKNIFIYCDRIYQNIQMYLDYWNDCQVHWILMEYKSVHVIVIKFRECRFFVLPMTPIAAGAAVENILRTRPNFKFHLATNSDRVDGVVIQNEKIADQLDSVITALFFFIKRGI